MSRSLPLTQLLTSLPALDMREPVLVTGVALDSRNVVPGGVFLACAGLRSHGLEYVSEAVKLGAKVVLWEPAPGVVPPSLPGDVIALEIPNLSAHAGIIAANYYAEPSKALSVVGVTGTNGKTSVSHIAAQALSAFGRRCAVLGTLGYGFPGSLEPASHTTPDAVRLQALLAQLLGSGAQAVAMEVSSHALEQHRVGGIQFRTAVFTNLSHEHLDYHGDIDSYAAAKKRLFSTSGLSAAVINADDEIGREILADLPEGVIRWAFATREESVGDLHNVRLLFAENISFGAYGLEIAVRLPSGRKLVVRAPLFGRFNALNLLAVFGVLLSLDIDPDDAVRALAAVRPVRGRMEKLGGGNKPLVIVDYAHTPDALAQALAAAREHCANRLICVFGCGGDRDRAKRPEMGRIAETLTDHVIVTDDNPRTEEGDVIVTEILDGMWHATAAVVERDREKAIRTAIASARAGDVVVIAGKGHEDYQIVGTQRRAFSDRDVAITALESAA